MPDIYDPETENRDELDKAKQAEQMPAQGTPQGNNNTDSLDPVRRAERAGSEAGSSSKDSPSENSSSTGNSDSQHFYNQNDNSGRFGRRANKKGHKNSLAKTFSNPKTAILGGGSVATIAVVIYFLFSTFIPLKIETTVNMLQDRFSSTATSAVSDESQNMLSSYITSSVLPGYKSCGTTASKDCAARVFGSNPVSSLFRTWSQARIENQLADDYKIEFTYSSSSKTWTLRAPGLGKDGVVIGADGSELNTVVFNSHNEFRQAAKASVNQAIETETEWKQVLIRYKVDRLLSEKFGIKNCVIYCGITDPLRDSIDDQKIAAKLYLTQKVIEPRNKVLAIALECLFSGCDPTVTQPNGDPGAPATNGAPENPQVDEAASSTLRDSAADEGITDAAGLDALKTQYDEISKLGFSKWVITEGLTNIGVSAGAAETVSDAIPIAGWINLAAQMVHDSSNSSDTLKKLRYVVNASAAISLYMMYRTYADEIQTGHATATEVGSMYNSLGPGDSGNPNDPEVGGGADAASTPLYQSMSGEYTPTSTTTSFVNDLLPSPAYADTTSDYQDGNYLCNNGQPVPFNTGQLVCPEESFGGGSSLANSIHDAVNVGGGVIPALATAWNDTIGQLFNLAGDIISVPFKVTADGLDAGCGTPAEYVAPESIYCSTTSAAKKGLTALVTAVTQYLIPDPFSTNMSGGRTFDMAAGGSDALWSDYSHEGIGGRELTNTEVADIDNQQQTDQQQVHNSQPLFARIFSTSDPESLVSSVAMDLPYSIQSTTVNDFSSLITSPFSAIVNNFSSIFSTRVSAATPAQADPFGIPNYGYTQQDINAIGDPSTYWDTHCTDDASTGYQKDNSYNLAAVNTVDPNTATPVNTTTDPCELIMATVGSDGGIYNSDLLTPDDLANVNSSADSTGTNPSTPTTGNAQQLAQQILSNKNISLTCFDPSVEQDVQDAANGQPGTAGVMTSAGILQIILAVGQSHTVCVTAIQSNGQGHCNNTPKAQCPNDPHYTGNAVDFGSLDGVAITGRNPPAITIMNIADKTVPIGAFGQSECGDTPPLPTGWSDFNDTCNHLHVQDIAPNGSS